MAIRDASLSIDAAWRSHAAARRACARRAGRAGRRCRLGGPSPDAPAQRTTCRSTADDDDHRARRQGPARGSARTRRADSHRRSPEPWPLTGGNLDRAVGACDASRRRIAAITAMTREGSAGTRAFSFLSAARPRYSAPPTLAKKVTRLHLRPRRRHPHAKVAPSIRVMTKFDS